MSDSTKLIERRELIVGSMTGLAAFALGPALAGCSHDASAAGSGEGAGSSGSSNAGVGGRGASGSLDASRPLPPAEPDQESPFHVDANINMTTIDDWIRRDDVEYTDMRMIHDTAEYEAIGGDSDLSVTVEGFKIVPFPYVGTLQELLVDGAYDGERLFDITWADDGAVEKATPRYEESMQIIEDLFPKDKANFIMCGGAGYAHMMSELLKYLGWDEKRVYNVGGGWDYTGTTRRCSSSSTTQARSTTTSGGQTCPTSTSTT